METFPQNETAAVISLKKKKVRALGAQTRNASFVENGMNSWADFSHVSYLRMYK
jgi:hypothetical protein